MNCRTNKRRKEIALDETPVILGRRNIIEDTPVLCCCGNTITTGEYYIFEDTAGELFYTSYGCGRELLDFMGMDINIPLFNPLREHRMIGKSHSTSVKNGGKRRIEYKELTALNKEVYNLIFLVCKGCWDLDYPLKDPLRGYMQNLVKYPRGDIFPNKIKHINNMINKCTNILTIRNYIDEEMIKDIQFRDFSFPLVNAILNGDKDVKNCIG